MDERVMTRQHVADRLQVSVATVRRMEGRELHPAVGTDGVRRFDPQEVEAVAARRPLREPREPESRTRMAPSAAISGDVAAGVFEDFEQGRAAAAIVVTRKLAPEVVRRLHADWLSLRELDVTAPNECSRVDELEARVELMEELWRQFQEERSGRGIMRLLFQAPRGGPTVAELFEPRPALAADSEVEELGPSCENAQTGGR